MGQSIFGIHESALKLQTQRANLIANNLANADTPGFKAKDINFEAVLSKSMNRTTMHTRLAHTAGQHLHGSNTIAKPDVLYRVPHQVFLNENSVETDVEKVKFMENSNRYMASIQFIDGTIKGLRKAIRGE